MEESRQITVIISRAFSVREERNGNKMAQRQAKVPFLSLPVAEKYIDEKERREGGMERGKMEGRKKGGREVEGRKE